MKTAFLFPGQGSQHVGMGKELVESNDHAKSLFQSADEQLGFSLSNLMFEGPAEELTQTNNTQPALYLHSIAAFKYATDGSPTVVAGHSLGEFSALVAAGVLTFEDGLHIVHKRGELMLDAGLKNPGSMAAVIGMEDDIVEEVCKEASSKTTLAVVPANFNSPGQIVISGHDEAVDEALLLLKKRGCKIAKKLPVSGAFHSPLMETALGGFKKVIDPITFKDPIFPVISNVTAKPSQDGQELKENVIQQLLNPVRWTQTLVMMSQMGVESFVEVGSGKVLQGLVKRTLEKVQISGVN